MKGEGSVSTQQLAKTAAARQKKLDPNGLIYALKNGTPVVWLSCLIMGLTHFTVGQYIKGLIFLAIEVAFVIFMVLEGGGFHWIGLLPSLGDQVTAEVWNDDLGIYEYVQGDNSQQILLYAVATLVAILAFVVIWRSSVRSGFVALNIKKSGKKVPTFWDDCKELLDNNIHKLLMFPPFMMLMIFTIVPLVYMMLMAFTNYSKVGDHLTLFDWVGMENFISLFDSTSALGRQFVPVLTWTLIWAFFATFLNFFAGTVMAMIINRPSTRLKGFWRTVFSLTIAVPQFVSLLIIRTMFKPEGAVNSLLMDLGWCYFQNEEYEQVLSMMQYVVPDDEHKIGYESLVGRSALFADRYMKSIKHLQNWEQLLKELDETEEKNIEKKKNQMPINRLMKKIWHYYHIK